jgi:hypothetical protein
MITQPLKCGVVAWHRNSEWRSEFEYRCADYQYEYESELERARVGLRPIGLLTSLSGLCALRASAVPGSLPTNPTKASRTEQSTQHRENASTSRNT